MRRSTISLAVLLVTGGLLLGQPGPTKPQQPGQPPQEPGKPASPEKGSLEDMLAQALKDHPDIRVAEAKLRAVEAEVRLAEAELARTRLQVMQKLAAHRAALQSAIATRDEAHQRFLTMQQLHKKGATSLEDLRAAELTWVKYRSEVAALEAQTPALLGTPPPGAPPAAADEGHSGKADRLRIERALRFLLDQKDGTAPPALPGSTAEKLRKALDTPVKADYEKVRLSEILEHLQEKVPGLTIRSVMERHKDGDPEMNLRFKEPLPLRAVLQALEDEFPAGAPGMRFVVREYGLLVTPPSNLPPGAVTLSDFLRGETLADKTAPAGPGGRKNPPAENVEGVITKVDNQSGLVVISIGSDAGVLRGHTLEVYRLKPTPKYLGTLRIVEVKPTEAVGKMEGSKEEVQVGDQVASKILGN
jgi:hypothetical protein